MKALLATTCLAVLAAVGYYFYGQWREIDAAREANARIEAARSALFDYADAQAGEHEKVKQYCLVVDDILKSGRHPENRDFFTRMSNTCKYFHYL